MEQALKARLTGAVVLLIVAVVVLPIVLDGAGEPARRAASIQETEPPREVWLFDHKQFDTDDPSASAQPVPTGTSASVDVPVPDHDVPASVSGTTPRVLPLVGVDTLRDTRQAGDASIMQAVAVPDVLVPVPAETDAHWVVQVGSFTTRENADTLRARLQQEGYPVSLRRVVQEAGGSVFRVYAGSGQSRAEAEQLRDILRQREHIDGVLFSTL